MSFWEFFLLLVIFIPLLMLWLFALTDLARRADISGVAKGLWAVAVVILPLVGMLVYYVARPNDPEMQPDPAIRMREIVEESHPSSMVDQLEKIAELHESGILSEDEFASAKARLLGTP